MGARGKGDVEKRKYEKDDSESKEVQKFTYETLGICCENAAYQEDLYTGICSSLKSDEFFFFSRWCE